MRARAGSAMIAVMVVCAVGARAGRHAFYRELGVAWSGPGDGGTRRVFGGRAAELSAYPPVCALLDRYWAARCSGAVVAPRWALTAAHCVGSDLAYIKYNSRAPSSDAGSVAPVHYLYRHPGFRVVQENEGRGVDVTLLHHDVGLVRTRLDMVLTTRPAPPVRPLHAIRLHEPLQMKNAEVQVLGFGRTERAKLGDELFEVRLRVVACERGGWVHCMCGVAADAGAATAAGRGVCSGDSGGPVLFRGAQVAVTSMGPLECAGGGAGGEAASVGTATSVFTSLEPYADLINATIYDMEAAMRMRRVSRAPPPRTTRARATATATLFALVALTSPAR